MKLPTACLHAATLLLAAVMGSPLNADPLPADPLARRCWLSHTSERTALDLREPLVVRFTNLREGQVLRSPFWVEFGVRGMGVIPAGNKNEHAGHHHLLIDTRLPRDHQAQIPFSATHRHFGKGQTGTELDLPDGSHTLRLLFADHEHRPYFAYSPEITIHVVGRRTAAPPALSATQFNESCQAWYQDQIAAPRPPSGSGPEVYIKNLRDDEAVISPFVISLGAVGMGVAPAGAKIKDAGYFVITVSRGGALIQTLALSDGRTETVIDLPKGEYELGLSLLDGGGAPLLKAATKRISVTRRDH
ncbi:hypothetical protein BH11PSE10_BH11PSE10_01970 [soil metagenome]